MAFNYLFKNWQPQFVGRRKRLSFSRRFSYLLGLQRHYCPNRYRLKIQTSESAAEQFKFQSPTLDWPTGRSTHRLRVSLFVVSFQSDLHHPLAPGCIFRSGRVKVEDLTKHQATLLRKCDIFSKIECMSN